MSGIDEAGLLPCRKCGAMDIDHWHGKGTQAEMYCNNCGAGESLQISDLMDYETRYAPGNDFSMETVSYPARIVEMARMELFKEWNRRAESSRPAPAGDADAMIREMEGLTTYSFGREPQPYYLKRDDVLAIVRKHMVAPAHDAGDGGGEAAIDVETLVARLSNVQFAMIDKLSGEPYRACETALAILQELRDELEEMLCKN